MGRDVIYSNATYGCCVSSQEFKILVSENADDLHNDWRTFCETRSHLKNTGVYMCVDEKVDGVEMELDEDDEFNICFGYKIKNGTKLENMSTWIVKLKCLHEEVCKFMFLRKLDKLTEKDFDFNDHDDELNQFRKQVHRPCIIFGLELLI